MQSAGYGRIVTVSSRGAFQHPADARDVPADMRVTLSSGYSAAKAAIVGLTAAVATDLAGRPKTSPCRACSRALTRNCSPAACRAPRPGYPVRPTLDPAALAPLVVYMASAEGRVLNGRFLYGGGGDIALLPPPIRATEGTTMLRHADVCRVGDISEVLGSMARCP
jgi:NAD(P)-dependent dehydrogenase (short-subunit alcohol dehydrogenase family)